MYRLPDELVAPGTPLNRILQHYAIARSHQFDGRSARQLMPTLRKQEFEPVDGRKISFNASR